MKKLLLVTMMMASIAMAEGKTLFDLKAQYLSGTLSTNGVKEEKYKVGDVTIVTDAYYDKKAAAYRNGKFMLEPSKPLKKWRITLMFINDYRRDPLNFRLVGTKDIILVSTLNGSKGTITVNDIVAKDELSKSTRQYFKFISDGKVVKVYYKQYLLGKIKNFGDLKKFDTALRPDTYLVNLELNELE